MADENQLNEQLQETEVKESFNLFKVDGALSRSGFFIFFTINFAYSIVISAIVLLMYFNLDLNRYVIPFVFIIFFGAISAGYISFVAYAKRIYDIIGIKQKAILYTIILFAILFALSLIPIIKYIGFVISLSIAIYLLCKKGILIK